MDELERSAQLLREALDELRKQGVLTAQTLNKLNRATAANTNAQENQADAVENTNKEFRKLYDTTKQVVGGFMDSAQQARRNREDFTSLNPAIRATGTMFGKTAKTIGQASSSVGDALMGLSLFLPGWWKGVGLAIGGLFKGGGEVAKAIGEEAGKAVAEYGQFVTAEIQRVVESFKLISSVGATGAMGMQGFVDMAVESGLSMEQFAKVISNNSQTLALFTGNTLAGAKTLVGVSKAARSFEDQFLKLGIGFEEQQEMYAKAVQRELLIGTAQRNDYNALAQSAKDYIYEINELTRITGLQKDAAQSLYDRQMADVRFQAILADTGDRLDISGKKVSAGLQQIAGTLEARGGKTLATGFQDVLANAGTDAAKAFLLATGGAGKQIAEDYRRGRITQEEALFRIDESIRQRYATLGGYKTQAALGKLGTAFESLFPEMFKIVRGSKLTVEAQEEAKKGTEEAAKSQDKATDEIVKAQKNLQRFAQELDRLVSQKILPNAAHHIQLFTRALAGAIDYINEKLGVTATPGGTGGQAGSAAGTPGGPGLGPGTPQAPSTGVGGAGAPSPEAAGTLGAIRDMIGRAESRGDYNVLVGGTKLPELTNMTIAEVLEYQKGMRARGHESTALGKYQITRDTLRDLVRRTGMDPETTKFDKATQDQLADELIVYRGMYNKYAAGAISKEKFMRNLSTIWAGLPMDASGRSYYAGVGSNKATVGWEQAMGSFANGGITSGPRSGYTAMLHGTEAVVPLPDGRTIPVEMTGMTDKMGEQLTMMGQQITSLNELVTLMRANNDISTRILRSSAS